MSARRTATACRECGAPIVMLLVIPRVLHAGTQRKWAPFEPTFDESLGIRPSHATQIGSRVATPLREGERLDPTQRPARIHHAVCPVKQPASARAAGVAS